MVFENVTTGIKMAITVNCKINFYSHNKIKKKRKIRKTY